MKKAIFIIAIILIMLTGCKSQPVSEVSSQAVTSVEVSSEFDSDISSETSSVKKIKKAVSSKEESSSGASSKEEASSKETTSSKASKEEVEDDSTYFPMSMYYFVNSKTGKKIHIGMDKEKVEKAFPPPEKVKKYYYCDSPRERLVRCCEYNNIVFGYYKKKLVLLQTNTDFEYTDDGELIVINSSINYGGKISIGDDYKKAIKPLKNSWLDGYYFLQKEKGKLKVMTKKDLKKMTKAQAKNVFEVEIRCGSYVDFDENKVCDLFAYDYMTFVDAFWEFGDWK